MGRALGLLAILAFAFPTFADEAGRTDGPEGSEYGKGGYRQWRNGGAYYLEGFVGAAVVDIELDVRAVGIKNVTVNEPFFTGHWPGKPVMPGVLQLEAMAQLAGVLLLRKVENEGKLAIILSIDRVKFRKVVVPGDQLRLEAYTLRLKSRTGKVAAKAYVGEEEAAEAQFKFMLVDAE